MDNKRLFSIILVVFIDLLGYSLILLLLPYYAQTFNANQAVTGLLLASYSIMQLIGAPILGRLSDRFDRRPILLLSLLGTFVGFLMMGLATPILAAYCFNKLARGRRVYSSPSPCLESSFSSSPRFTTGPSSR